MKAWLKADSVKDVQKFYDDKYLRDGSDAFKNTDWDFFFRNVEVFFPQGLRPTDSVLDCGAGGGHFLKSIVNHYGARHPFLCGIELSPAAAKIAKNNLGNHAFIHNGDYSEYSLKDVFHPNSFDVVTCFGTIEHAMDMEESFIRIFSYAKPGGIVMISFPLETEGCMSHIENEENNKNNERFGTVQEWENFCAEWNKPFAQTIIGSDLLMVFRKWVGK